MKLLLHIGHSKAGSSAIQYMLARSYDQLLDKGILYPKAGRMGGPNEKAHFSLCFGLRSDKPHALPTTFPESVDRTVSKIVLSCESFCHMRQADIDATHDYLSDYNTEVVLYLRNPYGYVRASYAQGIRKGKADVIRTTMAYFVRERIPVLDYPALIRRWESVGPVHVAVFDSLRDRLEAHFLKLIDVGDLPFEGKIVNRTPSESLLRISQAINSLQGWVPRRMIRRLRNRLLRSNLDRRLGLGWKLDDDGVNDLVDDAIARWDVGYLLNFVTADDINVLSSRSFR